MDELRLLLMRRGATALETVRDGAVARIQESQQAVADAHTAAAAADAGRDRAVRAAAAAEREREQALEAKCVAERMATTPTASASDR
ncbi:hypothetical protein ACGFI3_46120 [Nonomuraea wenchangensis]|uniref:hypothetical protein n=1 Tax=Nonomuraea wenchangensis TaxID=568860 RepID=UPI0037234156